MIHSLLLVLASLLCQDVYSATFSTDLSVKRTSGTATIWTTTPPMAQSELPSALWAHAGQVHLAQPLTSGGPDGPATWRHSRLFTTSGNPVATPIIENTRSPLRLNQFKSSGWYMGSGRGLTAGPFGGFVDRSDLIAVKPVTGNIQSVDGPDGVRVAEWVWLPSLQMIGGITTYVDDTLYAMQRPVDPVWLWLFDPVTMSYGGFSRPGSTPGPDDTFVCLADMPHAGSATGRAVVAGGDLGWTAFEPIPASSPAQWTVLTTVLPTATGGFIRDLKVDSAGFLYALSDNRLIKYSSGSTEAWSVAAGQFGTVSSPIMFADGDRVIVCFREVVSGVSTTYIGVWDAISGTEISRAPIGDVRIADLNIER